MKTLTAALAALVLATSVHAEGAVFSDIRLRGSYLADMSYAVPRSEAPDLYTNPVLPGFYPDPSIARVGDDYYLINSTFAFYPGIPIFHSRDLVNWTQIGNAIDRPGMLDFKGLGTSRGVFAPDISYHDGVFYIVNTCVDCGGNFLITATDPAGPWSDPVWLPVDGIDPSLFHDDDGTTYLINNGPPDSTPLYDGHRAIWIQAFDRKTLALTGPRQLIVNGGTDLSQKPSWIEGPHIFKHDGHYFLIAAEGGTGDHHSEVVFRADKVFGPYVPWTGNPILTQRDLDPNRSNPITSAGHADLVQTAGGDWWAVFLATRPYGPDLYNTGRETFLLPVKWRDGYPVILDRNTPIPQQAQRPLGLGTSPPPNPWYQDIHGYDPLTWLSIRGPSSDFLTVSPDHKTLTLAARPDALGDVTQRPSFVGLRQQNNTTAMDTFVTFNPGEGDRAGLAAVQSDNSYAFCGVTLRNGVTEVILTHRAGPSDPSDGVILAEQPVDASHGIHLTLDVLRGRLRCMYVEDKNYMKADFVHLGGDSDATFLSTQKAGGFVGTILGLYAYGKAH